MQYDGTECSTSHLITAHILGKCKPNISRCPLVVLGLSCMAPRTDLTRIMKEGREEGKERRKKRRKKKRTDGQINTETG